MQQNISDLEFLIKMDFRPEFLNDLCHDKPIFSIAVNYTLIGRGGSGHVFTHDPSKSIRSFWESLEQSVEREMDERLDYANKRLSELRSGKEMLFSYSQEEYDEEMAEINSSMKTIRSIPRWWDSIKLDDVGYFNFELGNKYNSLNVSKIRIEDVKKIHNLVGEPQIKDINSPSVFYKSFILQTVDFIIYNIDSPYVELNVPSVDVVESKKNLVEKMFYDYSNIPVGSLIQVNHPYIPFVFGRKSSSGIISSYSDYSSFWDDSFALKLNTVFLGYDRRIEDKSAMQIELRDTFPLNHTMRAIPVALEKKTVDDAIHSMNTKSIYVAKDQLVASSGWAKSWDKGIQRIYDGLQIKNI